MDFLGPSSSFSSLSPSLCWWTYDVFLSFSGEDTRKSFTAHLHDALHRRNIKTYIDDNLPRGEKISLALLKAIENSRISIVILSENYASSSWCLDELKKIIECRTSKQQMVLPVFYNITPKEVRHQRESVEKGLVKLKERFKDKTEVQGWKEALQNLGNLSGFTLQDKTEPKLIQEIVREVSKVVKPKYLNDVAKHPVGMESRLHDVDDILLSVGVNEIGILGIYGIGGVGKTNLAKEIYNSFADQFECCCFLENVREHLKSENGLIKLYERLLRTILEDPSLKVGNVDEEIGLINGMFSSKRVLLVLDDLDRSINVEKFFDGINNKFGLGSIIIITTRDEHLLAKYDVHLRYKVKELDHDEALQLFCWNAFKKENPNPDFIELTENVLRYAGGLPLALIALGSSLRKRDNHFWRSALEKYKRIPHDDIQGILRTSYDDLEETEKNIFLDIACFFTGARVEYVNKIHHACDFFPDIGIKELIDKSLITIDWFHRLAMHDLFKDMGREIVRQKSKEPGKRSRLWFHQDVRDVMEEAKGTNEIQGMLIELPKEDVINMHPNAFSKMPNLRIFINRNARFSRVPNYLSNKLRLLDWYGYPGHYFPQNFHGKNLIVLRMDKSLIKNLGNKIFQNLKIMELFECKFLTKIPDGLGLPALEEVNIKDCENLVEVLGSIGVLDKLTTLLIEGCPKLTGFPRSLKSRSLQNLRVKSCKRLRHFPEIEVEMKYLNSFQFSVTGIRELPSSIRNLTRLVSLDLSDSQDLRHLPNSVLHLQHLRNLNLGCSSIKKRQYPLPSIAELFSSPPPIMNPSFSDDGYCSSIVFPKLSSLRLCQRPVSELDGLLLAACYSTLEFLDLSGGNFAILPEWIKGFVQLRTLMLRDCKQLKEILELPPNIEDVDVSGCISLERFPEVSNKFEFNTSNFRQLRSIDMSGCHKMVVNPLRFEQNIEEHLDFELIFPGNKIPDLDYHGKMTPNSRGRDINVDWPYSDEIIACAVVDTSKGHPNYITIAISYNGVVAYNTSKISKGSDHILLHYLKLDFEFKHRLLKRDIPPEGSLQLRFYGKDKRVLIKSSGVRVVRKQKEINTLQIARWSPCVNVEPSMRPCDDDDNENLVEDLDSELGVGCNEGAIFDTLRCFVTFLVAKLQLGGCMGLRR